MPDRGGNQQLHERKRFHLKQNNKSQMETAATKAGENFCAASNGFPRKDGAIQCPNKCRLENTIPNRPPVIRKNESRRKCPVRQDRGFQCSRTFLEIRSLAISQSSKCALPSRISCSRPSSKSLCHCGTGMFFSSRRK